MQIRIVADDIPNKTGEIVSFDESVTLESHTYGMDVSDTVEVYVDHLKQRLLSMLEGVKRS